MAETTMDREAAVAMAGQLMDQGAPRSVCVATLQRLSGFSRASCYRFCNEAIDARGKVGKMARPTGSDLIGMTQAMLGSALAEASLAGDFKAIANLSKTLLATLQANGSITTVAGPEPDAATDTLMAVRAAHTPER